MSDSAGRREGCESDLYKQQVNGVGEGIIESEQRKRRKKKKRKNGLEMKLFGRVNKFNMDVGQLIEIRQTTSTHPLSDCCHYFGQGTRTFLSSVELYTQILTTRRNLKEG